MAKRDSKRESARRILWGDRAALLPHLLEHRDCGVYPAVEVLCETAGWTVDSFVVAAFFDAYELIVEVAG
jgi:hypothetical protein